MPHVIFDRKIDLNILYNIFEGITQDRPIIKITDMFLDQLKRTALFPTIVVESENSQHFLIEINAKNCQTTLRLYPLINPKKTAGVKISMGLLVCRLLHAFPDAKITRTNISDFIPEPN